jgi:signal transduction histidine kinase/ligand-binding sensor domain-containing protein
MRVVFFCAMLMMTGFSLHAQQYHYSLRNYKAVDGLPQSQVRAIVEDNNGYLWIGTEGGGLARFDGRNFKVYTTLDGLQSNIISSLLLDGKQNLWVIHPRGITKFNGRSFTKFEQPGSRTSATRLRRMFEFQDTLFFMSTPGHIGKIYNDSVYYWSRPAFARKDGQREQLISFVRKISDGTLFLCVNQRSFYARNGNESKWIYVNDQFSVMKAAFEYNKALWLQTDNGFWSVDIVEGKLVKQSLPIQKAVIVYDSSHHVFWTREGTALFRESLSDGHLRSEKVKEDIDFSTIVADSEGNTWLGSNGNGLFKYYVQDFDRCASENLTHVLAIHRDGEGATWVGSMTKGLHKIKAGKISSYTIPGDPMRRAVYDISESPAGEVYVGTGSGLGKYNKHSDSFEWRDFSAGKWKSSVLKVEFEPSGDLWLALGGAGIRHLQRDRVSEYTVDNGLNSNFIMSMLFSKSADKLFTGDEFGLSEISDGKVTQVPISGLENTSILAITQYRDSLLLLSTGGSGMIVFNPESGFRKFINTRDGLASDFIYFAATDEEGYFWVGSEKGITRLILDENFNVTEHLHYDYDNGLTGVETNQNAYCFDGNERYFGLVDGLYSFNDYRLPGRKSFDLHLTKVDLLYGEVSAEQYASGASGFFHIPENLSLPPEKNHVTFHFNKVNKRSPKSVKFKYFLQGFDKTWSPPSSLSEVTYSNLPPGDYTFMVMSTDINGGWKGNLFSYRFSVDAPFYARTGFIIGMIVFLIALIVAILYLRVRQRVRNMVLMERIRLSEQDKVRKDIARDFHDDMGNQLTRIINYISLLKMNGTETGRHANRELYTKVEQSAKYLYTGTRDFIWSIDPLNDELSRLFIHIRDFGEKIFEEKNISFRAVNSVKDTVKLPYGFSREANLIFKEAMTNSFKYSNARNVTLSLKHEAEGFRLSLEDDGDGFDEALLLESGSGLKNIRERAEKINASLEVRTGGGKGTEISVHFTNLKKQHYGVAI